MTHDKQPWKFPIARRTPAQGRHNPAKTPAPNALAAAAGSPTSSFLPCARLQRSRRGNAARFCVAPPTSTVKLVARTKYGVITEYNNDSLYGAASVLNSYAMSHSHPERAHTCQIPSCSAMDLTSPSNDRGFLSNETGKSPRATRRCLPRQGSGPQHHATRLTAHR